MKIFFHTHTNMYVCMFFVCQMYRKSDVNNKQIESNIDHTVTIAGTSIRMRLFAFFCLFVLSVGSLTLKYINI